MSGVDDLVKRLHRGRIDKAGIRRSPDKVKREAAEALKAQAAEIATLRERADALALQADEWEGKYAIVSDMNARLMKRLEVVDGVSWESGDGIACRDETIRLQDQRINRFLAEIATLRAELAAAREALHHIDALCPVDASGCTHAALSGLLYNIEMHAICALKVQP